MSASGMDDIVVLHLAARGDGDAGGVDVRELSDVLDLRDRGLSSRVALLSTLETLTDEGYVEERVATAEGSTAEDDLQRTAYGITELGRARAADVRERLADERVEIRDGDETTVPLGAVDRYLDEPAVPRALARMTDENVLYLETPGERFVGRQEQLAALIEAYREAEDGGSTAVLVSGTSGIGKTTLVADAFAERVRERGGRVAIGTCRADETDPYAAFREVLGTLAVEETPLQPEPVGEESPATDEYEARRTEMFDRVASLLEGATDEVLVVIVEDLDSADEPTVALLSHLVEATPEGVVLVGTYRPEPGPGTPVGTTTWDDLTGRCRTLSLPPLDRSGTRRVVQRVTGRPDPPSEFVELVHERTGGVPLFVEELVARTVEDGIADPTHGMYPTDGDELPLPESVEAVVEGRLDVLDDETGTVLSTAALFGRTVPLAVLATVVDVPARELRTHVELLVDAGILEPTGAGTVDFANGLVRRTVLERIPEGRRRELHGRIADAYDRRGPDDVEGYAAVARHRRESGAHERAFEAYREAGDRAIDVYAAETARELFTSALTVAREELDWADDDERILSVLERTSEAYRLLDDYEAADRYLRYVAERTGEDERLRSVAGDRAQLWRDRGDFEKTLSIVDEALESVGTADTVGSAGLLVVKGEILAKSENYDAAKETFDRGLSIAERMGDRDRIRMFRRSREYIDMERGTVDEGTIETWKRAARTAREDDDDERLGDMLTNLGISAIHYGDLELADDALTEAIEVYERIGLEMQACDARNTLGAALTQAGRLDRAIAQYEAALETARELGHERVASYTHNNLAEVLRHRGEFDDAVDHYERALDLSEELDNPHIWTSQAISFAGVLALHGEADRAADLARRAKASAVAIDHEEFEAGASVQLGHAKRGAGDPGGAVEAYEAALESLDHPDPAALPANCDGLYYGLARALLDRGEPQRALEAARAAESVEVSPPVGVEHFLRTRATLARCRRAVGDLEGAERALEVEDLDVDDWPVGSVALRIERGLLARARGEESAGTELLSEALDHAREMGAGTLVERCRSALEEG